MAYHRVEDGPWPYGTTVAVWPASAVTGGVPSGMPLDTDVATEDGTVVFGGLTEGGTYVAFGHGGSQTFTAVNEESRLGALPLNPFTFGAVGDGVVDDRPAFAAMLAALPARGGRIMLGGRTFYIASALPQINVPVVLEGYGAGIVPATAAPCVLKFAAGVKGLDLGAAAQYSVIRDLYLQSQSSVAGSDHGIACVAHGVELSGIVIDGFGGDGVHIDTSAGGNANNSEIRRVRVTNLKGNGPANAAFYLKGVNSNAIALFKCDASVNAGWGFRLEDVAMCSLEGVCHAAANQLGAYYDGGNTNHVYNFYSEAGAGHTAVLAGSNALWLGGAYADPVITNNDQDTNRVYHLGRWDTTKIGVGGTTIKKVAHYELSIDLPSIAANTTIAQDVATAAGLVLANDRILLHGMDALEHGLVVQGLPLAPATDTIRLRVSNLTAAPIDAASHVFYFTVIRY